jgi:hypothetical protein
MTLKTRAYIASLAVGVGAIAGMTGLAAFAAAAEAPGISAVVYNHTSGSVITTGVVGTILHTVATVTASSSATTTPPGTVDFNVYSNTLCTGSPTTQAGVSLVLGQATSSTTVLPIGGVSYKVHYTPGNDLFTAGDSACMSVSATQSSTAISLTLSTTTSVLAGSFVNAIPNLTGETAGADGTLQYRVYSNNTCSTLVLSGDKTVTNGSTPNSDSWQFITPGTYFWRVAYSGDADNASATSTCNAAGTVLTVVATSSTPTTTPGIAGTISGTVFNDVNKNDKQDNGEAGLSGWTIWLHKQATSSAWWNNFFKNNKNLNNAPIVATATTDGNGNYSFSNLSAGSYFVEEKVTSGWKQTSDDTKVVLNASKTSADVDFANIMKNATSTKNHDKDKDDKDNKGKGKGADKNDDWHDNGNHNGWFKFNGNIQALGNVFGWLKISKK